jgi:hypothetical protein
MNYDTSNWTNTTSPTEWMLAVNASSDYMVALVTLLIVTSVLFLVFRQMASDTFEAFHISIFAGLIVCFLFWLLHMVGWHILVVWSVIVFALEIFNYYRGSSTQG